MCQALANFTKDTFKNVKLNFGSVENANDPISTARLINTVTKTVNDAEVQAVLSSDEKPRVNILHLLYAWQLILFNALFSRHSYQFPPFLLS